ANVSRFILDSLKCMRVGELLEKVWFSVMRAVSLLAVDAGRSSHSHTAEHFLRSIVSRLFSVAIDGRVIIRLVAFRIVCNAITGREADAQCRCAPRYGSLLKLFAPIECVFNCLYLICHSLFYLRNCIRDRVARHVHPTLKLFFGGLLGCFACASES